jgi:hypothetical protein
VGGCATPVGARDSPVDSPDGLVVAGRLVMAWRFGRCLLWALGWRLMTYRHRVAWWWWDVECVLSLPLAAVTPEWRWRWEALMRAKLDALSARQDAEWARWRARAPWAAQEGESDVDAD